MHCKTKNIADLKKLRIEMMSALSNIPLHTVPAPEKRTPKVLATMVLNAGRLDHEKELHDAPQALNRVILSLENNRSERNVHANLQKMMSLKNLFAGAADRKIAAQEHTWTRTRPKAEVKAEKDVVKLYRRYASRLETLMLRMA